MLKQVQIFVENRPGKVHAIMETLKSAEVNARAISITESADCGFVRLIVNLPEKAESALKSAGFMPQMIDVIGVTIPDKFGAFCDVVRILGESDINIEYSYSLMGCKHGNANILIRVKDPQKTAAVLTSAGVKLFGQADLS
jgi:hypothetical protein